jgi:hypothetical protein
MQSDQELFEKFRPPMTEVTDARTMEFFKRHGLILSVNGKRAGLDNFALVLAAGPNVIGPLPLNSTAARALCSLLIESGFGPGGIS